jgi:hypothetical protein
MASSFSEQSAHQARAVGRRPSPSTCYIEPIVDALTGVIVCGAGADSADQPVTG